MGLDYNDVLNWEGRSKRVRKPPPVTYWEEFVATDEWYLNELTADVPEDEWKAAVEDDVSDAQTATDPSYSSDEDGDESDASDGSDEGGDDWTAELVADGDDDASDDECSDECSESSDASSDASASTDADSETDRPATKRQRRG